jgi:DNA glycosylase AlkZ-like
MTPDIAQWRLHNHHLSHPDFVTPADVVRWFGAVQAQDLFSSLYAIGLRMPAPTEALVEQAVADKAIVRSWPMRGTIHFMAAEDAPWMLKLLALRQEARIATFYRRAGLTDEVISRAGDVFARALRGGKQLTRKEIYAALAEAGIDANDTRGLHLLAYWARRGLICWGPRCGKQPTFVLLDEWLPRGRQLAGDEALAELARRYFTSHGPATARDFAWWSGLTLTEAKTAIEAAGPALHPETSDGRIYWSGPAAPFSLRSSPDVYLLPAFDEFTVAYEDRSAFLDPQILQQVQYGLGPLLLIDGCMAGTWKRTLERDRVGIKVSPFLPLTGEQRVAMVEAAQRYARFLGLALSMAL